MNSETTKSRELIDNRFYPMFNNTKRDELKKNAKQNRRVSKKNGNKKTGIKRVEKEVLMEYKREVARIKKQKKCKVPTLKQFLDKKFKTRKHHKKQSKNNSLIPMPEPVEEESNKTTVESPEPIQESVESPEQMQESVESPEPTQESTESTPETTQESTESTPETTQEEAKPEEPANKSAISNVINSINPFSSSSEPEPKQDKTTGGKKSGKRKSKNRSRH